MSNITNFITKVLAPLIKLGAFIFAYYQGKQAEAEKKKQELLEYGKKAKKVKDNIANKSRDSVSSFLRKDKSDDSK